MERETKGTSRPVALLFHEVMYGQMCHARGDPVCDHLEGRGWKNTLWTFFFAQLPICIKLIRNWFFETCQAWLELPSSFINKKWRAGGKKSQERYQNNHTHKRWMTAWASLGNGLPACSLVNQFSWAHLLSPYAQFPQALSEWSWAHHWGQKTLLHGQNPRSQVNHCNSRDSFDLGPF